MGETYLVDVNVSVCTGPGPPIIVNGKAGVWVCAYVGRVVNKSVIVRMTVTVRVTLGSLEDENVYPNDMSAESAGKK